MKIFLPKMPNLNLCRRNIRQTQIMGGSFNNWPVLLKNDNDKKARKEKLIQI